jgi:hypothetical protein
MANQDNGGNTAQPQPQTPTQPNEGGQDGENR